MGFWKNTLPAGLFNLINNKKRELFGTPQKTYSGEGEDLIIEKYFKGKRKGFYVDIGCYHPKVGSNTYKLFQKEWRGINIDMASKSVELFNKLRPNDINLNVCISPEKGEIPFYEFVEGAVNTTSEEFYEMRLKQGAVFHKKNMVKTATLEEIFDKYCPNQPIDMIDIDAEGMDVAVLKTNNWEKYKPTLILVEDQDENVDSLSDLETYKFLQPLGYKMLAKTISTAFYHLPKA